MNLKEKISLNFYHLRNILRELFVDELEKEREIQAKLAQIIITSSDPEELKNKIVREVAIALNASRCIFLEYDPYTNNFKKVTNAYNTKRDDISVIGFDFNKEQTSQFSIKLKYMKDMFCEDTKKYLKDNKLENSTEEEIMNRYNIKAFAFVRLQFGENFLGVVLVHYGRAKKRLKKFDLKFLTNIAEHISIALHLSTLYNEEKGKKEKEQLLRHLITIMNEDYQLDNITKKVSDIMGTVFSAQTIYIEVDYNNYKKDYLYNISKFMPDSIKYHNINALRKIYAKPELSEVKKRNYYIKDTHNFIVQNNLEGSSTEKYFTKNMIKSLFYFPITNNTTTYGHIISHFEVINALSKDDIEFIKMVTEQFALAIKQTILFEQQRKTAEREELIRKITERIRSSLDLKELIQIICKETTNVFNVQRTAITTITKDKKKHIIDILNEFKLSPNVKGIIDTKNIDQLREFWADYFLHEDDIVAIDDIENSNTPEFFKETYTGIGVKSILGAAIKKGKYIWGTIVLSEYREYRHWTEEEKMLLRTIADQIYIAIHQAELFSSILESIKKESSLRKIFATMSESLDINIIKKTIVTEIGKALKADICIIAASDNEENYFHIDENSEYRSSDDIKSMVALNTSANNVTWFNEEFKHKNEITFADVETFLAENELYGSNEEHFLREYNIKSSYSFKVKYDDSYAYIILHYTKKPRILDNTEKQFVRLITTQAGVALHQACLYKMIQTQAESEKNNRTILEILRNSLDKEVIKSLFVKNIGKFFNANRVFFIDYDSEQKAFLPVEPSAEYLSSPALKSFVGIDWMNPAMSGYTQYLLEKREVKIPCWSEAINNVNENESYKERFRDAEVQSSYSLPVIHEGNMYGYFCVEFTQHGCKILTNEDITRIRSMCAQAGIALYQAELYIKAQEASKLKDEAIKKIEQMIESPAKKIVSTANYLNKNISLCSINPEYINNILKNGEELLKLTTKLKNKP